MDGTDWGAVLDASVRVLGVIASLVAAIVAVDQLTVTRRLRRRSEWLRKELDCEQLPERRRVLQDQLAKCSSQLVAEALVPNRRFFEPVATCAGVVVLVIVVVIKKDDLSDGVLGFLATVPMLALAFRRGVRVFAERARIYRFYYHGDNVIGKPQIDILSKMEVGTMWEFMFGALGAACVVITAIGGGLLYARSTSDSMASLFVIGGVLCGWQVFVGTRGYVRKQAKETYAYVAARAGGTAEV